MLFFPLPYVALGNYCVCHRNQQQQPRPLAQGREEIIQAAQKLLQSQGLLAVQANGCAPTSCPAAFLSTAVQGSKNLGRPDPINAVSLSRSKGGSGCGYSRQSFITTDVLYSGCRPSPLPTVPRITEIRALDFQLVSNSHCQRAPRKNNEAEITRQLSSQ